MPYQPGPFGQASPADIHVAPGVYDFTSDAAGLQGDLHAISAGWDGFTADLEVVATEPWDAELALDLDGIIQAVDVVGDAMPPAYMDDVIAGWWTSQSLLDNATAFAPPQAWIDPGEAFVPPDSVLTLVPPTIDPAAFTPAPNEIVGATTAGRSPALGLFNLTSYGSQNFTVGDQLEVVALGPAGADVVVNATLNGETLPAFDVGQIDSNGQLFFQVTLGPDQVGVWHQLWYIDGAIMANFNFVVTGASS